MRVVVGIDHKLLCRLLVFASCLSIAESKILATTAGDSPKLSTVRCERKSQRAITREHEVRLEVSLRRITGFEGLQFASDGSLNLGNSSLAKGGSGEARRILIKALASDTPYIIEDCSGSSSVIFGQAEPEQIYEPRSGKRSQVWRLRLDFDDFRQMSASSEVRATFDEGFTLLHELLHGLGYQDPSRAWELGPCEEIVNRVRRELGLPLRDQYFGEKWRVTEKLSCVRLRFRNAASNSGRWHYMSFLFDGREQYSRLSVVP